MGSAVHAQRTCLFTYSLFSGLVQCTTHKNQVSYCSCSILTLSMTSRTFVNSTESSEVHLIRAVEHNHVFSKGLAHVFGCFCNKRNVNSIIYANGPVMICYVHVLTREETLEGRTPNIGINVGRNSH